MPLTGARSSRRRCGIGSWGGECPGLAGYVTGTGRRPGAPAAGGRACCVSSLGRDDPVLRASPSRRPPGPLRPYHRAARAPHHEVLVRSHQVGLRAGYRPAQARPDRAALVGDAEGARHDQALRKRLAAAGGLRAGGLGRRRPRCAQGSRLPDLATTLPGGSSLASRLTSGRSGSRREAPPERRPPRHGARKSSISR